MGHSSSEDTKYSPESSEELQDPSQKSEILPVRFAKGTIIGTWTIIEHYIPLLTQLFFLGCIFYLLIFAYYVWTGHEVYHAAVKKVTEIPIWKLRFGRYEL